MEDASGKHESSAETSGEIRPSPENLSVDDLKIHIESVDKKCKTPELRALEVYEYLKKSNFTTWDICCFCVNWLGTMSIIWPWLLEPTKVLSGLVYRAHYFFNDKILGEESKLT